MDFIVVIIAFEIFNYNIELVWILLFSCSGEPNEVIDAELSARVLQLINFMDAESYVQVSWLDIMIYNFCYILNLSSGGEVLRAP